MTDSAIPAPQIDSSAAAPVAPAAAAEVAPAPAAAKPAIAAVRWPATTKRRHAGTAAPMGKWPAGDWIVTRSGQQNMPATPAPKPAPCQVMGGERPQPPIPAIPTDPTVDATHAMQGGAAVVGSLACAQPGSKPWGPPHGLETGILGWKPKAPTNKFECLVL